MLLRNVKHHRRAEDRGFEDAIPASLDAGTLAQIDRPSEYLSQLLLHMDQAEQRPRSALFERHNHIHIALRPEVVAHDAAEKRKLCDLPLAAEVAKFFFVVVDRDVGHRSSLRRSDLRGR